MVAIATNGIFNVFNVPSCLLLLRGRMHLLVLKALSGCAQHDLSIILQQRQKLQYSEPSAIAVSVHICGIFLHLGVFFACWIA